MEFEWTLYQSGELTPEEVAESFEDPFSLRLLPDSALRPDKARYFNLGKSISNRGIGSIVK